MRELRQSTAVTVKMGPMLDSDGAPVTTLTIQKADLRLSKNGGNMAAASADQGASDAGAPHDELGVYDCSFNTTDTNTLGHIRAMVLESGAIVGWEDFNVLTANDWDAKYDTGTKNANVTQFGGSNGTFSGGRPEVNTTHAAGTAWGSGAITAASIASDAITAAKIAADAITAAKIADNAITAAKIADAAITAAKIASAAITAAKIDADAITAAKLAADVTTELQTGLATASGLSTAQTAILGKMLAYFQLALRGDAGIGTDLATELGEINTDEGSGAGTYDPGDDSQQGTRDAGATLADFGVIASTTIASLASQTSFTLTAGSADNDAYNDCQVIITDATTAVQKAIGTVSDYVGSTKTITLSADPGIFTMAAGDLITILPPAGAAGGGGGDATEANQDIIIGHLVDIKGSGFGAGDSLKEIQDAMALDSTVAKDATVAKEATLEGVPTTAEFEARTLAAAEYATAAEQATADGKLDDILAEVDTEIEAIVDALAAAQTTLDDLSARLPAALASGLMQVDVKAINAATAAAVRLALSAGQIIPGTVDSTGHSPTTTEFEADDITEATADHYNGRVIIFTSGALLGQACSISDYSLVSGRGHFTVSTLTEAPANNGTFIII